MFVALKLFYRTMEVTQLNSNLLEVIVCWIYAKCFLSKLNSNIKKNSSINETIRTSAHIILSRPKSKEKKNMTGHIFLTGLYLNYILLFLYRFI